MKNKIKITDYKRGVECIRCGSRENVNLQSPICEKCGKKIKFAGIMRPKPTEDKLLT